MEKLQDRESKNDMLTKKIKEVEETVAELKCRNKELEENVKETKAENDALKSKQTLEILKDKSIEVKEAPDQEYGEIENQCSKCNFVGKLKQVLRHTIRQSMYHCLKVHKCSSQRK